LAKFYKQQPLEKPKLQQNEFHNVKNLQIEEIQYDISKWLSSKGSIQKSRETNKMDG